MSEASRETILAAVDLYVRAAYAGGPIPVAVQRTLEELRHCRGALFDCPCFVRNRASGSSSQILRLGNRVYQHMKLVIDPAPDGTGYLFRADTHDSHLCPDPMHPEFAACARLREENQRYCAAIEQMWQEAGIETFATFLRRDLDRRRSASKTVES